MGSRRTEYKEGDRVVYDYELSSCRYLHGSLGYVIAGPIETIHGIRYRILWDEDSAVYNSSIALRDTNFNFTTFSLLYQPTLEYDPNQQGDRDDDI